MMMIGVRRDDWMKVVEYGAGRLEICIPQPPGQVGEWENTRCHHCNATLIRRFSFMVRENRMVGGDGLCPDCHKPIPGIWVSPSGHGMVEFTSRSRSSSSSHQTHSAYNPPLFTKGPRLRAILAAEDEH